MILAERARANAASASADAIIARLRLKIEKLRRAHYGVRSERKARLLEQMELQLEELETAAAEEELLAEKAAAKTRGAPRSPRKRPSRKPFPAHLPRERVVIPAPACCPARVAARRRRHRDAGGGSAPLEGHPNGAREVFLPDRAQVASCGSAPLMCESIAQPPAPFHATPRGFAGPSLLAMILFEKFGQHQPLNRQSERYAREGVELSVSTLADQVGACAAALLPLYALIEAHVLSAERLFGDDTTVPILAKGKTVTGRIWTYVVTIGPLQGPRRQLRSTTLRGIEGRSIPNAI